MILERERRGRTEILTLNRPEARNAMSPELSLALDEAFDELEADRDVRTVVVTGNGPVFCAGADLKVIASGGGAGINAPHGGFGGLVWRDFPKPVIAAVNGPAVAGGFELVLACDLVVAADHAVFGLPEVQRGLLAAAGGPIRLARARAARRPRSRSRSPATRSTPPARTRSASSTGWCRPTVSSTRRSRSPSASDATRPPRSGPGGRSSGAASTPPRPRAGRSPTGWPTRSSARATPSRAPPPSPRSGTPSGTSEPAGRQTGRDRAGMGPGWGRQRCATSMVGVNTPRMGARWIPAAGRGAGPAGRRLGRHDPLLPEAPAAPPAHPRRPHRLVRTRARRAACRRIRDLQRGGLLARGDPPSARRRARPADVPLAAAVAGAAAEARTASSSRSTSSPSAPACPRRSSRPSCARASSSRRHHDGDARFTPADVEIVRGGFRLLEAGLPLPELLALARRHDDATRAIAEEAVALFDEHVREPLRAAELTDDERAERLVDAFRTLLPTVTSLVAHHFRRVLLEVAQEHLERVGEATELAAASDEPGWTNEETVDAPFDAPRRAVRPRHAADRRDRTRPRRRRASRRASEAPRRRGRCSTASRRATTA